MRGSRPSQTAEQISSAVPMKTHIARNAGRDRLERLVRCPYPASRGRLDQAKRFALSNFDKWNDVTGFVAPHTGYYYELCAIIEDGVEFGFGVAHDQSLQSIVRRIRASNVGLQRPRE